MGFFLNTKAVGFRTKTPGLLIECPYSFVHNKASCQFDSIIITAILDGGNFIIKKVAKFFSSVGKFLYKTGSGVVNFVKDGAKAVGNFVSNAVNKGLEVTKNLKNKVFDAITSWW